MEVLEPNFWKYDPPNAPSAKSACLLPWFYQSKSKVVCYVITDLSKELQKISIKRGFQSYNLPGYIMIGVKVAQ